MRMNSVPKRTGRNFSHKYCAITCAYENPYISGESPSRGANVQILIDTYFGESHGYKVMF